MTTLIDAKKLSHDLKSIAHSLEQGTDLLVDETMSNEEDDSIYRLYRDKINQLSNLLDKINDFKSTKPSRGKL